MILFILTVAYCDEVEDVLSPLEKKKKAFVRTFPI